MRYFILIAVSVPIILSAQPAEPVTPPDSMWQKAIINLECRKSNTIEQNQNTSNRPPGSLQVGRKETGTAVFISHINKRYLITCQHVVRDGKSVTGKSGKGLPDKKDAHRICNTIFKIPLATEIKKSGYSQLPLTNLADVPYESSNFIFSDPGIDLTIISLDGNGRLSYFADQLERNGYRPIPFADSIDSSSETYGEPLTCLGYPVSSIIGVKNLNSADTAWSSDFVCMPSVVYGRASTIPPDGHYFIGDISAAPGSSGSPVINSQTNKWRGIAFAQAYTNAENSDHSQDPDVILPLHFLYIIRASCIWPLLKAMIQKDARNSINISKSNDIPPLTDN